MIVYYRDQRGMRVAVSWPVGGTTICSERGVTARDILLYARLFTPLQWSPDCGFFGVKQLRMTIGSAKRFRSAPTLLW